jgi:(p)ppGpp synthase/HD superfamily hydrolase
MNQWGMVGRAIELAVNAHEGQIDKSGYPYILHPMRVMLTFNDPYLMAISILHDMVEDTNVTLEDLSYNEFPERVIEGVRALTHLKADSNDEYYAKVKKNKDALEVKIRDIFDNMSTDRMKLLSERDRIKLAVKYGHALEVLYGKD